MKINQKLKIFIFSIFLLFLSSLIPKTANAACSMTYGAFSNADQLVDAMNSSGCAGNDLNVIKVGDDGSIEVERKGWVQQKMDNLYSWAKTDLYEDTLKNGVARAFWSALNSAVNTIAYDTATWIGSGGQGQKPLFVTEDWGAYLTNIADNAAGTFIEEWGKNGAVKFNLCEPDLAVRVKIGLGLVQKQRPSAPACTFSEMVQNWDEELQREDFLTRFQDMFDPASNDLSIALSLHTGILQEEMKEINSKELELTAKKGWLDVRNLDGSTNNQPGLQEMLADKAFDKKYDTLGKFTGTFSDATNIFLNQLAITAFNKFMQDLAKGSGSVSSSYSGNYGGLSDVNAQKSLGASGLKDKLRKLIEPSFKTRGDYNILSELSSCPNPAKAGPTNCVITEKFRQAISEKKTVVKAMQEGYLNAAGIFGFTVGGSLEPSYADENYPYRSMIILRKYRILPVGWELAAQYIKKDPNLGVKNLGDMIACFDSNDEYGGYYENWCRGLVDPNWVLKAPANYCKREGAGPEIIFEEITGEGRGSELMVGRNENYCADEQSCIKENKDGSCQLFGYCSEERRKWDLGADSCEPRNNTCQTFRGADGSTVSYLENSLDYTGCAADNVGCKAYSLTGTYANSLVQWSNTNLSHFDKDIKTCNSENEGCSELIRVNSGANLFTNASFEDSLAGSFWGGLDTSDDAYDGAKSLALANDFTKEFPVGPSDFTLGGNSFALSFYAKDCGFNGKIDLGDATAPLATSDTWNRYTINYLFPVNTIGNGIYIGITGILDTCKIDAVKLEFGESASDYSEYGETGVAYQKMLPSYLESTCYENPGTDYSLKSNAPSECNNFARQCNASEEGCEMYTAVSDGTNIPAKTTVQDYCPGECVGYDTYIQSESHFDSLRDAYFIPSTAKSCSAEAAGCDQFTNLDKVSKGGEGTEYYSYLRQCIKPDAAQCSDFYTWEGSDETGFQLKVVKLKKDNAGNPAVSGDDSLKCSQAIYNLAPTDPSYNPDCREFYNKNGTISYHLISYTISCSDSCYPFRRTKVNIDPQITDLAGCGNVTCSSASADGKDKCWDDKGDTNALNDECLVCKNGGTWDIQGKACVYMAVPEEGVQCAAKDDGCREYSGNTGNNVRIVLNNDFEGSTQGWTGGVSSNEALTAGGNSLYVSNASAVAASSRVASTTIGTLVLDSKSYNLKFLAKPSISSGFTAINSINLVNGSGDSASFTVDLGKKSNGWQIYEVNLTKLDHKVDNTERLEIKADGNIYIDDVKLTEISDRYYLIKDSWNTPESCNQDAYGNPYPLYMLGCDAYNDRDNRTHNLHSFSNLCQESAVGCELMIDTQNSSDYAANVAYSVAADKYIYAVYDKSKQCGASDKGCSLMGELYKYDGTTLFSNVYLKNNPDDYSKIRCSSDNVGCQEWTTDKSTSYFKDPGDQVCEWRQAEGQTGYDWYKKKVKRCDTNSDGVGEGSVCLNDNNCSSGQKCQMENTDGICPSSNRKTLGYGGNSVYQPDAWTGICSASESGCTELIDPISKAETNIVFNADFSQDVDNNNIPDGWEIEGNPNANRMTQDIVLEPNTLYILAVIGSTEVVLSNGNLYELSSNNNLSSGLDTVSVWSDSGNNRASKLFYTSGDVSSARIRIVFDETMERVELKKALVDYALDDGLDKTSCNGLVNFEDGCVLFNERSQNGTSLNGLKYDADLTIDDQSGVSPDAGIDSAARDSNMILKVTPDRVCNKWLACRSMAAVETDGKKENVCFDIGLCNSVDENGNCNGFAVTATTPTEQTSNLNGDSQFSNASGYSKVGYAGSTETSMKGNYKLGSMDQVGEFIKFPNGGFEFYDGNMMPIGWIAYDNATNKEVGWDDYKMQVINNPISAQTEGVKYAPEGKSFLLVGTGYNAVSEDIEVVNNVEYVLTGYINTENLTSGTARMKVKNIAGNEIAMTELALSAGNKWTFKLGKFNTGNNNKINVVLETDSNGGAGNVYFDDIKLRPALNVRASWYVPQSCRLYPRSDSLACEYFDDSGKYQKGWYGYCLEYDRYPGNPDACLMWWPTDKVKGDGVEEGGGYSGRTPLYYCAESAVEPIYEYRHAYHNGEADCGNGCNGCPSGYSSRDSNGYSECFLGNDKNRCYCIPIGVPVSLDGTNDGCTYNSTADPNGDTLPKDVDYCVTNINSTSDGWYLYDGLASFSDTAKISSANPYVSFLCKGNASCTLSSELIKQAYSEIFGTDAAALGIDTANPRRYCTKIAQVVSASGNNKYWSGRVYEGSSFQVCPDGEANCGYSADYNPFGSLVNPNPPYSPHDWDSKAENGTQPLFFEDPNSNADNPRAGHVRPGTEAKRLFSLSYGGWQWESVLGYEINPGSYAKTALPDLNWNMPTSICSGGVRPAYTGTSTEADYCAIIPRIQNIKVNEKNTNIDVRKTAFINLTFNATVDSQQLPLVMYAIDWGDNEKTIVSGVEMRDRQSPDNPFSLYHLYDYWDLKAKNASSLGGVTCGSDNTGNYCDAIPKIRIRDNWGWCNGGTAINDCDQWENFGGAVRVYEK